VYRTLNLPTAELHSTLQTPTGREIAQLALPVYRCPSDASQELNDLRPFTGAKYSDLQAAKSNYIANHGTQFVTMRDKQQDYLKDSFGVFWPNSKCTEAQIIDGTSNTILLGERSFEHYAGTWIGTRDFNNVGESGLQQVFGISDVKVNTRNLEEGRRGFSSEHPGGTNFVYADGHVDFIVDEIEFNQLGATSKIKSQMEQMGLYQKLLRRNDRQINVARRQ
jgi:prepilin-type processing-associated H-X9-DG protein